MDPLTPIPDALLDTCTVTELLQLAAWERDIRIQLQKRHSELVALLLASDKADCIDPQVLEHHEAYIKQKQDLIGTSSEKGGGDSD
jgi:hypothetical protein